MVRYGFLLLVLLSTLWGTSFKDVPQSHWAKDNVNRVVSENIINGYKDNTFRGTNNINRYEMTVIISRVLDFMEKYNRYPAQQELTAIIENDVMTIERKNGVLRVYTNDKKNEYSIDGRILLDFVSVIGSKNDIPSGAEARKVRFAIKTVLEENWNGEFDLAFNPPDEVKVQDFWVGYDAGNMLIKVGNHKLPVSVEKMTSSRYTTFMERSLPVDVFTLSRRLGISVMDYNDFLNSFLNNYFSSVSWVYLAGLYFDELGVGSEDGNKESMLYAGRAAVKLEKDDLRLLTGFSGYAGDIPDADNGIVRLRSRGETHQSDVRLLDTGVSGTALNRVKKQIVGSYEITIQKGSLLAQAEFINANYLRESSVNDAFFSGYYFGLSYILTGEQREYSPERVRFDGVIPDHAGGAWEVALRFSHVNLNDSVAGIYGGLANNWTLGLNWFINTNTKMMLNYVITDVDEHANADNSLQGNDDHQLLAFRMQYLF